MRTRCTSCTAPKLLAAAIALAGLLTTATAFAQSRWVVVNGIRMSDRQISQLEYYNCAQIPNGSYWLNLLNGARDAVHAERDTVGAMSLRPSGGGAPDRIRF